MRALFTIAALLLAIAVAGPATAQNDQERARRAMQAGLILPLERIVSAAHGYCRGRVIDVRLVERGPRFWVYHLKFLTPRGHVLNIRFNAGTGQLLGINGRGARVACRY